jgi:hypothetical protein
MAALAAMTCLAWGPPASAQAASAPSIESESVSNLTSTDATLEAQINPGGLETSYEFRLETPECQMMAGPGPMLGCELVGAGKIPPGSSTATVSTDIAKTWQKLTPNTTYLYVVFAKNAVGSAEGRHEGSFTTPPTGTAPVIDSVSLSHLTPTDATLEAQLNTEGLSTLYQFQLWYRHCRECMSPTYNIPLPSGLLLGSFEAQSVSLDLNSAGVTLKPGFYEYSLSATSTGGTTAASFEPLEEVVQPLNSTPSPSPQPTTGPAPSTGQSTITSGATGPNNLTPPPATKLLTNAQKLTISLRTCKHKPRKQRASCGKQARRRYGATVPTAKKR